MADPAGTLMGDYSDFYSSRPLSDADEAMLGFNEFFGIQSGQNQANFIRSEQAANNAFYRDMLKLEEQNRFNASEAEKSRDFNSKEAQIARDFNERMSNTQYQRAVKDMQIAGLNPVLAFQHAGAPFSSATGASTASSGPASSGSGSASRGSYSGSSKTDNALAGLVSIISGITKILS